MTTPDSAPNTLSTSPMFSALLAIEQRHELRSMCKWQVGNEGNESPGLLAVTSLPLRKPLS